MIERRKPSSEMIRLLIRRSHRNPEPKALRRRSHRRDDGQRLVDGPLRCAPNRRLQAVLVHVVAAENVGDEDAVEFAAFEKLRERGPVREGIEIRRLVVRVFPEAGGVVPRAHFNKGVDD